MTLPALTNTHDISLVMSVWLAHSEYDNGAHKFPGMDVISATALIKPMRQLILSRRVPMEENKHDVADFIASKMGTAIHDSVEKTWTKYSKEALTSLGYTQKQIAKVKINPDPETVKPDDFPIYLEQRFFRQFNHHIIISGQSDQIVNGELNDIKTTSVFGYLKGSKEEDYRLQGSIYRWLRPDLITRDTMKIQFVFTDWQKSMINTIPNYPKLKLHKMSVDLMSLKETENWIRRRINQIYEYQDAPQSELPLCSDKELWRSDPKYKYYSDPAKAEQGGRSTRNFDSFPEAMAHKSSAGKGAVVTVPGKVKACLYCPAFSICAQRQQYEFDT